MTGVGEIYDDEDDDAPEPVVSKRAQVVAEWQRVRSARRIYTVLNEAGKDVEALRRALARRLLELDPSGKRLGRCGALRDGVGAYQAFMLMAAEVGEPMACDVARELHPAPPAENDARLNGYLFNKSRRPTDRSPRMRPNARNYG